MRGERFFDEHPVKLKVDPCCPLCAAPLERVTLECTCCDYRGRPTPRPELVRRAHLSRPAVDDDRGDPAGLGCSGVGWS